MAVLNKLTDTAFRQARPKDKEQLLPDGGGLYVRIRSSQDGGNVSFRLTYRIEGKQKWLTLGSYPTMSLKEARNARDLQKAKLSSGIDPSVDNAIQKLKIRDAQKKELLDLTNKETVNKLFKRWASLELVRRKDKGAEIKRMFNKDVLPFIGDMAVESVRKTHVIDVIDRLLERGVNRMAKLILALMRQMFRFAQDRDIIEFDPTSSIRKSKIGGADVIRDRFLNEEEIRKLSNQLPQAKLLPTSEIAIWIMLSTCCRIGELCKARWEHVDLDLGVWRIPEMNSKNGKAHTIYLSDFALGMWKELLKHKRSTIWVYPNTDNTDHVCEKSISKQISDRQLVDDRKPMSGRSKQAHALILPNGKWTPHDLRRTGATLMGSLGVRPDVIELCLNHIEQNKMKKTYQLHTLVPEQKEAWQRLGNRLYLLKDMEDPNLIVVNF